MVCPVCGTGDSIALWGQNGAPTECVNPQHDLLKHCPDCGKLFGMDENHCDQPQCDGRQLEAPPSTWADADGGVQRRRLVRTTGWAQPLGQPEQEDIVWWPMRLSREAGDTLVSAYSRLYLDSDPNVLGCRANGDRSVFPNARPAPLPTAIVAHSGRVAVLSRQRAYLLDATNLTELVTVSFSATAQIIADGFWWLIGRAGIARVSLEDAAAGLDPDLIWSEPCDTALPPVRMGQGTLWVPMQDGRHVVVSPEGEVRMLDPLPEDEEPFAAFCTEKLAVLLSRRGGSGSAVRAWSEAELMSGNSPSQEPRFWDFSLRKTWGAMGNTAYVCPAGGGRILQLRLDQLNYTSTEILLATDDPLDDMILLENKLLIRTRGGQFRVLDPETERAPLWNPMWNGGDVTSWTVWDRSIVAVLRESDHCRIVTIPCRISDIEEAL